MAGSPLLATRDLDRWMHATLRANGDLLATAAQLAVPRDVERCWLRIAETDDFDAWLISWASGAPSNRTTTARLQAHCRWSAAGWSSSTTTCTTRPRGPRARSVYRRRCMKMKLAKSHPGVNELTTRRARWPRCARSVRGVITVIRRISAWRTTGSRCTLTATGICW